MIHNDLLDSKKMLDGKNQKCGMCKRVLMGGNDCNQLQVRLARKKIKYIYSLKKILTAGKTNAYGKEKQIQRRDRA
jgi:hypothetical protein